MTYPVIERVKKTLATQPPKKIAFSECNDPRIIETVNRLSQEGLVEPILIGEIQPESLREINKNIAILSPTNHPSFHKCQEHFLELRRHKKNITVDIVKQQASKPLVFSYLLLSLGIVDGCVNGAVLSTTEVVRNALQLIGTKANALASSFFLMLDNHNDNAYIFADCALIIDPNAEELATIALQASASARLLLQQEPKVAMLSFSTHGSATHASVDKIIEATQLVSQSHPKLLIDGEVQLDAAIVPEISRQKLKKSMIHGQANVLIFPDLNSGNIGYKLVQRFAHATAVGPFLQGLNKPANDLSRGASAEDIYLTTLITALQHTVSKAKPSQ